MAARKATGYFGIPGRNGSRVHFVEGTKPICGIALPKGSEFQWCAWGFQSNYIECKRCKDKAGGGFPEFINKLIALEQAACHMGLFKTYHALNKAKNAAGYERAYQMQKEGR